MRTYPEIMNYIDNAHRFGNMTGVEITAVMLEQLGHPEKDIPFVHVAGTNGKGSTCAFLDSILRGAGYKVGLFTSPHLVDFEERIVVNGRMISKEDVTRLANRILDMDFGIHPTYFDYCLAIAILYFQEQQVDIAIIETGLGGTYDSTNALGKPLCCAIAKIGFDHMAILGNTLGAIAGEKAGIMKEGVPVVMETQEAEALEVLLAEAARRKVSMAHILTEEEIAAVSRLKLQIPGVHQWENGALAVRVAEIVLEALQTESNSKSIQEHDKVHILMAKETFLINMSLWLERAKWPGRMELLSEKPFYMVDGAHNGNGVSALAASLRQMYPGEKFHFFMGVLADKDYEAMVEQLIPLAEDFRTITPESSRALQADALAEYIRAHGVPAETLQGGVEAVPENLCQEGRNVAFGSLYFVGELKALAQKVK